jgi:hypothetical protein
VGALVGGERRFGAPRQPVSSPVASGRKGDREGLADSAAKYSKVGITRNGEKAAMGAQNLSRNW